MFDKTSRYYSIEDATLSVRDPDGTKRDVAYKRRRFIPAADTMTTLVEHIVVEGDRLDNITARYLSDPLQFWRVCDANDAMKPEEVTDQIGRSIIIAFPK